MKRAEIGEGSYARSNSKCSCGSLGLIATAARKVKKMVAARLTRHRCRNPHRWPKRDERRARSINSRAGETVSWKQSWPRRQEQALSPAPAKDASRDKEPLAGRHRKEPSAR